ERGEIHRAEVVDRVEDRVELIFLVRASHAVDQPRQTVEDPAVDLVEPRVRLAIARRIEVVEVAEQEPERVAHPPIGVGKPVQDLGRHPDLLPAPPRPPPPPPHSPPLPPPPPPPPHPLPHALPHLPSLPVHPPPPPPHPPLPPPP